MSVAVMLSLALLQATAGAPAQAADPAPPAPPAATTASAPDGAQKVEVSDPVVCHWIASSSSGNFSKKQCHPISYWARLARDGQ